MWAQNFTNLIRILLLKNYFDRPHSKPVSAKIIFAYKILRREPSNLLMRFDDDLLLNELQTQWWRTWLVSVTPR